MSDIVDHPRVLGDPLSRLEAILRRQHLAIVAAEIAGSAFIALFLILFLGTSVVLQSWLLAFAIVAPSIGTALGVWFSRRSFHRSVEFYRRLAPRMKDLDTRAFRGLPVLLDNGLVFQFGDALMFTLAGRGSEPIIPMSVQEALLGRRGARGLAVGTIGGKKGPEEARRALEAIRKKVGSRWAFAHLFRRRPDLPPDPSAADWVAIASFSDLGSKPNADRIIEQLDAIGSFLEDVSIKWFPDERSERA